MLCFALQTGIENDYGAVMQLEFWETIIFKLNDSKRYRRTIGSLGGSCLAAATPLLASANQATSLIALDIIEVWCPFFPFQSLFLLRVTGSPVGLLYIRLVSLVLLLIDGNPCAHVLSELHFTYHWDLSLYILSLTILFQFPNISLSQSPSLLSLLHSLKNMYLCIFCIFFQESF